MFPKIILTFHFLNKISGATGAARATKPDKTPITRRLTPAAATAFYFAKSSQDRSLAGLTSYGAPENEQSVVMSWLKIKGKIHCSHKK